MTISRLLVLASLTRPELDTIMARLDRDLHAHRRGRPWSCSLRRRILITCVSMRTNLTFRARRVRTGLVVHRHRIVAALVPALAALVGPPPRDRRASWLVDGTLIPTRDHACASEIEALPVFMQRADLDPPTRPPRRRDVSRRTGQSQRSGSLPRFSSAPRASPCRGWLSRYPGARHSGVSR